MPSVGCWACYALTPEDLWSPCRHCGRTGQEPPKFSDEDLRLIIAMCETACPFYPERDMYPAWKSVHDKATALLGKPSVVEHDEYECLHYDDGCRCQCEYCLGTS